MKIRKLKVIDYKVIDELDLDFTDSNGHTLNVVVFAGVNGCGKTTILELIKNVFSDDFNRSLRRKRFGFRITSSQVDDVFPAKEITIEFEITNLKLKENFIEIISEYQEELKTRLETERKTIINREGVENKFNVVNQILSQFSNGSIFSLTYKTNDDKSEVIVNDFEVIHSLSEKINDLGFNITYIPYETYMNKEDRDSDEVPYHEAMKERLREIKKQLVRVIDFEDDKALIKNYIIRDLIQTILNEKEIPPKESVFKIINRINDILKYITLNTKIAEITTKQLIFNSPNGKTITLDGLSSGEKQLFYRFVYLNTLEINESIIMVDEPETSLHPLWQQQLVQLYGNIGENNQIFLATHSPHVIASVTPESIILLTVNSDKKRITSLRLSDSPSQQKTKGVEPNRILKEVMGVLRLTDEQTLADMEFLSKCIDQSNTEDDEFKKIYNRLLNNLGNDDPFIMSVDFEISMLNRKGVNG